LTVALITEADASPGESDYLAAQLSGDGIKVLRVPGPEITVDHDQVRILVPFVTTQVTAEILGQLPHLGVIATWSTGTDHIDTAEAARRGITIANVPDYGSVAVAEHTFALLLTMTRIRPHLAPGTDLSGAGKLRAFIGVFLFPLPQNGLGQRSALLLNAGVWVAGLALTLVPPSQLSPARRT
jgi:hypothetical protein